MGKLTYVRVYSGILKSGETVLNSTRDKRQRVSRLFEMHANDRTTLDEIHAGDVGAAVGLSETHTGDTLCNEDHPIVLESIEFPSPVMSMAIWAADKVDRDKLGGALARIADEDPTFLVRGDAETGDLVISGMGELHLEVIVDRLRREFGVPTSVGRPQVAYRETIVSSVEHEYKHVKQTGGRGQYAHIKMRVEPGAPGYGFSFTNEVVGGNIPREFIAPIERGIVDAMMEGPFAGYPVVDVKVAVIDGSAHDVDSSDMAFRICGSIAFREALRKAGLELLEPVMSVEATASEDHTGPVTASLCGRRGRIVAMETRGKTVILRARVPLAEMFGYSSELRNLTSGRGEFTMHFECYEAVPDSIAEEVVKARREAREKG